MFARLVNTRIRCLVCAAIVVTVIAGLWLAPRAFAKIVINTVDPVATVSHNGRRIRVTGPLACDQTQPVWMRVTVTQRTTGAVAEGFTRFIGAVPVQQWQVHAITQGNTAFEPGPATVVALAQSKVIAPGGGPDDAHQWLVDVTLVEN